MKILVVGAGAIGAFYGGKLAQVGVSVSVVCRSEFGDVAANGFDIQSTMGDFNFKPTAVFESTADAGSDYDVVFMCTKVLPEIDRVSLLRPVLGPNTLIVLLQNGIFIEAEIKDAFPNNAVVSGLAFVCINRLGAGKISHQGYGRLVFGIYQGGHDVKLDALIKLFEIAGVSAVISDDIQLERWRKLVWNAPFNPMSVVYGPITTDEILKNKELRKKVTDIMAEVLLCAAEDGCVLPQEVVSKNIKDTERMAPYKTSMLMDFEAGRRMESDAILGNAIRFANDNGVSVPVMSALLLKLQTIEKEHKYGKV